MVNHALSVLVAILIIAYPIMVHQNIDTLSPSFFAALVLSAFILRFIFIKESRQYPQWLILLFVIAFCTCVIIYDSEQLLKFYPVMMNTGIGLLFISSLRGDKSLIEQFVHASGRTPPNGAIGYLKKLTLVWGLLLLTNGAISTYTACCTSLSSWALYNGFISYIIIGIFIIAELFYRIYFKRKHNLADE